MTPETDTASDRARLERDADLAWIGGNLDLFWAAAAAHREAGRGAVVVDTAVQTMPGLDHPFTYFPQELVRECGDEDTMRMVDQYDPSRELVLVLLKDQDRTSTYRLSAIPPDHVGASKATEEKPDKPPAVPELAAPDIETLMGWEAEGGCEAACPYGCRVEPDGVCPHGNPSWLLKLGFI